MYYLCILLRNTLQHCQYRYHFNTNKLEHRFVNNFDASTPKQQDTQPHTILYCHRQINLEDIEKHRSQLCYLHRELEILSIFIYRNLLHHLQKCCCSIAPHMFLYEGMRMNYLDRSLHMFLYHFQQSHLLRVDNSQHTEG